MGKGKGVQINLDFILRVVEVVLLVLAIALFMINDQNVLVPKHTFDYMRACDTMCIAGSLYVILLLILLGQQLIKGEEQDQKFVAALSCVGCIFMICSGLCVCIFSKNKPENVLISGIVGLVAGGALLVDCLKGFGVF